MHQAPNSLRTRWITFGTLCGVIALSCLVGRFPLLAA